MANGAQPVDEACWRSNVAANVAREPRFEGPANWELRSTTDVAGSPYSWAEEVSGAMGDSSTQTTTEGATESGPLYTDLWALLANDGYEAW